MAAMDLTGKNILITGASSGIGEGTAQLLADLGAKCVLVARNEERLKKVLDSMPNAGHRYYVFDLTDVDNISDLMNKIVAENGPLDGLVYCAGVSDTRPIRSCEYKYMRSVMDVNFFAYHEIIRCMMKKKNHGTDCHIVGISSCASAVGQKGQGAYSASKAAMDAVSRVLADELASKGAVINTIRPGMIRTEMYKKFLEETGREPGEGMDKRQILGIGEVEDVAGMAAFLLSPLSKFITGSNIPVDGGYTCH